MAASTKERRVGIIILKALCAIFIVLAALLIGVNAYILNAYPAFYAQGERAFAIPGIQEGFIPQDIDHVAEYDCWLFSGYACGNEPSPVYLLRSDGTTARLAVLDEVGEPYFDHGSAITSNDQHLYLTCEGGYLVFDLNALNDIKDGDVLTAQARCKLDFSPAFMNIEDDLLYTGNFYHPESYETDEMFHVTTPSGSTNRSVIYVFEEDPATVSGFAEMPTNAYSIPDRIQGCAFDGKMLYLSQSYGLATSHVLAFDMSTLTSVDIFQTAQGPVDMTVLEEGEAAQDLALPPMSEGIEIHDGKLFISFESASNKYLFGKLYGAGAVYALPLFGR